MSEQEELPNGWIRAKLSDIVEPNAPIIYGILQPGPDTPDGVPYVRPTEIVNGAVDIGAIRRTSPKIAAQYSRSRLRAGDVLLSIVGTIGKVAFVPPELDGGNITQSSVRLRPDSDLVSAEWLAYALRSPATRQFFDEQRLGTGVPRLNVAQVREFEVPLPPIAEQRRIVAKLDELLASSRAARAALAAVPGLADQYWRALLRAAFTGRLIPESARDTGEDCRRSGSATVVSRGTGRTGGRAATVSVQAGEFALSVGDAGLPAPDGWQWMPLSDVASLESGHTPSRERPEYWDGGIPWIGIKDARTRHGRTINTTTQSVSDLGLQNSSARLLPAGTVCLSRTASVGYVVVMGEPMATSQDFVNWVCSDVLEPHFLKYLLMAEKDSLLRFSKGTTHRTIYFPEVKAFWVCIPERDEQRRIVARLDASQYALASVRANVCSEAGRCAMLDAATLAKAFRGELVPQDPADEPASALLARRRAERASVPASRPRRAPARA